MSALTSAGPARRAAPQLVSVVVPVLNGEKHLAEQLAALASQTYAGPWELVIVDNGCTDGTLSVVERSRDQLPDTWVADATAPKGLNHARNVGARVAKGDFLAFCDADDVVTPGWLEGLADAARFADVVGGVAEVDTLNGAGAVPSRTNSPPCGVRSRLEFLDTVCGGNCGVWTAVARRLGWDESFDYAGSDIEFSWRAALASYRLGPAPHALIRLRQRQGLLALARQWYLFGKSDAQLYRVFRDRGMPRSSTIAATKEALLLVMRIPDLFRSTVRRRRWVTLAARRAGRVAGSIRHRVFFP